MKATPSFFYKIHLLGRWLFNFVVLKKGTIILKDFYVSYGIHAYVSEAKHQVIVFSQLHGHIQDVCNEQGIELMSPHFMAHRAATHMVMNPEFIPKDYEIPRFDVDVKSDNKNDGK